MQDIIFFTQFLFLAEKHLPEKLRFFLAISNLWQSLESQKYNKIKSQSLNKLKLY